MTVRIVTEKPAFKAEIYPGLSRITTVQKIGKTDIRTSLGTVKVDTFIVTVTVSGKGKMPVTTVETQYFIPPAILAKYRAYKASKAAV